jgi:hypothetical protein
MSRFCRTAGVVVPASGAVSPHAFDFVYASAPLKWGCNHLRCRRCARAVRDFAGWTPTVDSDDARLLALSQHGDIAAAERDGLVERDKTARLYVCGCQSWAIVVTLALDEPPDDLTPIPPWGCAGHPRFALPARLDGVDLSATSDWDSIARRALSGELARDEAGAAPWGTEWLSRVRALLEPDPVVDRLAAAALACATDDDERTATAALLFFSSNPALPEVDQLIAIYQQDRARFDGRVNPGAAGRALTWWLQQAIAQRLLAGAASTVTLDFARASALAPGAKCGFLLHALEQKDAAWVSANLPALRAASPDYDFGG